MNRIILFFLFSGTWFSLFAQDDVDPKLADQKFLAENYTDALEDYLSLLEKDPKSEKYNFRVAVCYLNTEISKAKAVPYLEIVTRMSKYDPDAMYLLGRAYHFAYRFDDAIKCYQQYKLTGKGTPENLKDVDQQIQYCFNAKELMKFPLNVTFENLGKDVNSEYADYFSFVPADESFLVLSTRRPETGMEKNEDGTYPASIFMSKASHAVFQKAKSLGEPINTNKGDAEVIGLSAKGDIMLIYYKNFKGDDDIYISYADKNGNFKKAERLPDNINSAKGAEIAASLSSDGNTIFFASYRPGGLGGTDLYVCKKLPNGTWGPAVNLGPQINTPLNEDFPNISPDGKTLYFSSSGHTSMGGYDIFRAEWDESSQTFVNPKNIGYPINTPEDNYNFRISATGRYGYVAACLPDKGIGDLDIYRVTFNDVEPQYTVVRGNIAPADSAKNLSYADVFITVTDTKSGEIYGNYTANPNSGNYVIILPPGTYTISVESAGFKTVVEKLDVLDKNSFKHEISKDIRLSAEG
ncbi:MAG: hypothetical protein AB1458_01420 [Bacteroidota bacterium]